MIEGKYKLEIEGNTEIIAQYLIDWGFAPKGKKWWRIFRSFDVATRFIVDYLTKRSKTGIQIRGFLVLDNGPRITADVQELFG